MKKSRQEIVRNLENSLREAAKEYQGGYKGLANDLGIQPGTFNNKCLPGMDSHRFNIQDIVGIIEKTNNHKPIFDLADSFGYVCIPMNDIEDTSDINLLDAWAEWDSERGETAKIIRDALVDHSIGQGELDKIKSEMLDDIQKEMELFSRLESIADVRKTTS